MSSEQEHRSMVLKRDLIFLILQYLNEEKYNETLHQLERESGNFFNMNYFEKLVLDGNWDETERYLSGFTKLEDNRYSTKIFFELRKQKYLEALEMDDRARATNILVKDLKVFAPFNEELFKELTNLLMMDDFREHEQLADYADATEARLRLMSEFKQLLEANILFRDKLIFPNLADSRLQNLIHQSFNWQHILCRNPSPNPEMKTLFVDHKCSQPTPLYARPNTRNQANGSASQREGFIPMASNVQFQPIPGPVQTPYSPPMRSLPTVNHQAVISRETMNVPLNPVAPPWSRRDHEAVTNTRPSGISDRMTLPDNSLDRSGSPVLNITDELPMTVIRTLNQGSRPVSMDFHPVLPTLLLVGASVGDIGLWEVGSQEKLFSVAFQIWDVGSISTSLKSALVKDPCVEVKCIKWSPNGSLFGAAYSKHILHLYSYRGENNIEQHLEIESHIGSVNDLAFASSTKQLSVITCGDDKTIKVWEVATGINLFTFEGHEAPVFSVFPHVRENVRFIFSTSTDGKIKAWLYDTTGAKVNYDAPGGGCTTIAYSFDGIRLFSCGTSQNGETHLVEWIESEGVVKRSYKGLHNRSSGIVRFGTTNNRFLAAGDNHVIKFWEMDSVNLLATSDAGGDLPGTPCIRFNKEGTLLAASTSNNRIKILATLNGIRSLQAYETPVSNVATENGDKRNLENVPKTMEEVKTTKTWKLTEISEPAQLRSLVLPDSLKIVKILRLIYTNSSNGILALASNAIHKLWKWPPHANKGQATTKNPPQLWQPTSGILMTNDLMNARPEEAIPCFALSKNDSYLISASGGQITLFNMTTFKTMTTFMHPPPVPTFVAFQPQDNNTIAIGMDDSTVQIYNARVNEVKCKLKGHSKRISGLAFSSVLNLLVSSGADDQIIVWQCDKWIRQKSCFLQLPAGRSTQKLCETEVQFHHDQRHFLAVHELQLAVYETLELEFVAQWLVPGFSAPITHATFSCDSQLVYSTFLDGTVIVFCASDLQPRCRINPAAYLPSSTRSTVYPLVIAANPQEPNQFAIGLTDGTVHVCEPLESDGEWGVRPPPAENS